MTFVSEADKEYMFLFTADAWTGDMKDCDEGKLEWVPMDAVDSLPIWEGDRIFFRLLRQNSPFFSLKLVYTGDTLTGAWLNGGELPL